MAALNKVMIIGNLGRDPEIRYTSGGTPVANFSIATTEKWKNKEGVQQEETEWHNIVAWKHLAEISQKYLSKGSQVYIEGRIKTREWNDRDGNKRKSTEIVASQLIMLGSPRQKQEQQPADDSADDYPGISDSDIPF